MVQQELQSFKLQPDISSTHLQNLEWLKILSMHLAIRNQRTFAFPKMTILSTNITSVADKHMMS